MLLRGGIGAEALERMTLDSKLMVRDIGVFVVLVLSMAELLIMAIST